MDNRDIKNITINYENGESETLNKGLAVNFIDNVEKGTVNVRYNMCKIKGSDLALVVQAILALADKLNMFDEEE